MKNLLYYILALAFMITLMCTGCSSPYWRVYHHDGVERRGYLKAGWPHDNTCSTYYTGNRPVQRATWSKQFYYRTKHKN